MVQESHAGAVIAFGGREPSPQVMLGSGYGSVILGQPLALAATLNRLQAVSSVPLLATADFEYGAGMRIAGATRFPRAMAVGAAGDEQLAFEAGGSRPSRGGRWACVNFAPVADVNNNARNPVINTRSFGEDPARVGALVSAYVRGLQQGGMLATLKHFPGHGDTEVDSHLGLPLIRTRASGSATPSSRHLGPACRPAPPRRWWPTSSCRRSTKRRARHLQSQRHHGPAAPGDGVRRADCHRLDEDGCDHADGGPGRGRRARGGGGRGSGARLARPRSGVPRD
ncbi:MAG: glycoside hydrolase family 3 N-terminal domain-containing protein [Vicinamibacterales bacterium]